MHIDQQLAQVISGQFLTGNYICRLDQKVSNFKEEGTDPFLVQKTGGCMKSSNIGGQAVLEGIMMKNGNQYAVAVRKPDLSLIHIYEKRAQSPGHLSAESTVFQRETN